MTTVKQLSAALQEIEDDLELQYPEDPVAKEPVCHILHRELGLGTTPKPNVEQLMEQAREAYKKINREDLAERINENDLEFTIEHEQLHKALKRLIVSAAVDGNDIISKVFILGRRYGMREFMLGGSGDDLDAPRS